MKLIFDDRTEWRNEKDELHRVDGPAVEYYDGCKFWYLNGQRHRVDGHATEWPDGSKFWYQNNQLHREDGPAVEWADGSKTWYIHDKELTEKEFLSKK